MCGATKEYCSHVHNQICLAILWKYMYNKNKNKYLIHVLKRK